MAGNIKIIEPKENYQKVAKSIILNDDVDALTLGIYVKVLCLGKRWELNIKGLGSHLHVSADKIRASFAVLEKTGYLVRKRSQDKLGRFNGWDYEVSCAPITDIAKTPMSENTDVGKNRRRKNDTQNGDIDIKDRDIDSKNNIPPTPQEVEDYVRARGWADPKGFAAYYVEYHTFSKWHMSNGKPVKNWKLNIISWEPNNKNRYFSEKNPHSQSPAHHGGGPRQMTSAEIDKLYK